jgi:hypothetical protein
MWNKDGKNILKDYWMKISKNALESIWWNEGLIG